MGGISYPTVSHMRSDITIRRERSGFEVRLDDPEIVKKNREREEDDGPPEWTCPSVEYNFDTFDQVLEFLKAVGEKALPDESFSSAFDREAKKVMNE